MTAAATEGFAFQRVVPLFLVDVYKRQTYESRIRLHIIPEIGDIPLNKLTQNDLQQFYGRLKKSGRKRFTDKYGDCLLYTSTEKQRDRP